MLLLAAEYISVMLVALVIARQTILWCSTFKRQRKQIPSFFSLPLIGAPAILRCNPCRSLLKLWKVKGSVFSINIGNCDVIIVNGSDAIRKLFKAFPSQLSYKPISGTSRLMVFGSHQDNGRRWDCRRAALVRGLRYMDQNRIGLMQNNFSEELEDMLSAFQKIARPYEMLSVHMRHLITGKRDFVEAMESIEMETPVDFPSLAIAKISVRLMYRITYGEGRQPDLDTSHRINDIATHLHWYPTNAGPLSPLERFPWFPWLQRLLGNSRTKYEYISQGLRDFCKVESKKRRRELDIRVPGAAERRDLSAHFAHTAQSFGELEARIGLTDDILFEGLGDVMRAGSATTSGIIGWAVQYLAKYPKVQRKLQQEVDSHATRTASPGDGALVVFEAKDLPYCTAFMYEMMRLVPTVPFLKRLLTGDITAGGLTIPKGSTLLVSNSSTCMDQSVWENPSEFNPERFLKEDGTFDDSVSRRSLPFGIGRRLCPAENIAKQVVLSAVASLVHNFYFAEHPDHLLTLKGQFGITIPHRPFKMIVMYRG